MAARGADPVQTLTAAAKARSQAKTEAAEQAIRTLVKRGVAITFRAVQREAGVSHAFLYNHPDLRGRIERLRAQARPAHTQAASLVTQRDGCEDCGRQAIITYRRVVQGDPRQGREGMAEGHDD